jgi:glycosyltransferase involved in cell wall biosynthesis
VSDAGPREIVEHGITGMLVPTPEPQLLAGCVRELLTDHCRLGLMALAARRAAVERFGVQVMVDTLAGRLESLAGEREAA